MKEEIFGPLLPILTVRTKHELLLIVMAMHYALMVEMLTLSVYQSCKLNRGTDVKNFFLFLMGKVWASVLIVMLRIECAQENAILRNTA